MKITVYTTTDCEFSKQEKEYLNTHKQAYEEKNLETNKEFLTEMLVVSNNFAGTPVTKIEKDDGSIAVLKGFTQKEFDETLGFAAPSSDLSAEASAKADQTTPQPPPPTPQEPPAAPSSTPPTDQPPVVTPPSDEPPAAPTDVPPAPPTPPLPSQNDQLSSILDDLQKKSAEPAAVPPTPTPPSATEPTADATTPTIPDFQAK